MNNRTRTLLLKVEVDGRVFDFSDQELLLTGPSVQLRFLRYGYSYDNKSYIEVKLPPKKPADDPQTKEIAELR
ncbi:MAG: hypothetical protein L3J23_06915, partial [Flavobacteriaceae bacterium]|nr:hypothetical protein [Flavobacteriaceae bacterium]MCF6350744.1 hypothetical protein [Flavobacteriaceae bacterium]